MRQVCRREPAFTIANVALGKASLGVDGAGHEPYAAQTDHRMKAVATVVAVDIAAFFRQPDPAAFQQMVGKAGKLRSEEAAGKPAKMVEALPQLDEVDEKTPESVREFVDYYKTPRGQHPRSTNRWVERSVDLLDQWDAFAQVKKIAPRPLLMIAGSKAETLPFSQEAVKNAGDTAELFVVDGATHVDLYDRDEYLTPAVAELTAFFGKHLAAS